MAIQRKKKNKYLPMLILVAILGALIIGTSLLSAANDKKAAEEAAALAAQNQTISLAEYDVSTTVTLSYARNGEDPLSFSVKNGAWVYDGDEQFPLNQTKLASMASALSSMAATRTVEDVDMDAYGLREPAYVIRVGYADGVSHEYCIGSYNSFSGEYYFTMDGDCYMISSGLIPYFDYELNELLQLDTLPAAEWQDVNYVSSVTVTKDGVSCEITDEEGKTAVLDKLEALALTLCTDYYATPEEKAVYGMDGSNAVSVKYKKAVSSTDESGNQSVNYLETTYTLILGSPVGHNEGYYGGPEKSSLVYQLGETAVNEVLAFADDTPVLE